MIKCIIIIPFSCMQMWPSSYLNTDFPAIGIIIYFFETLFLEN